MNTDEWTQHLAILTSSPYLLHMAQAAAGFERLAYTISLKHNLSQAYSVVEVMEACKEVCSHQLVPSLQTMYALAGSDKTLLREFIVELGKITAKGHV